MKREFLEKQGLEKEMIDIIMKEHGNSTEAIKRDLEAANKSIETTTAKLTEANTAIQGFKALNIDEIKKNAEEWQGKYNEYEKTSQATIDKMRYDYGLETNLATAKLKDHHAIKAVKALLDTSIIKIDKNGEIKGLTEQLASIKTNAPYLFTDEAPQTAAYKVDFGKQHADNGSEKQTDNSAMNAFILNAAGRNQLK